MTSITELATAPQRQRHERFNAFVTERVIPYARRWDREERLPDGIVAELGRLGWLGCTLPEQYGGRGWDAVTFGLLNEALGRGSSALTGVLTVQTMVSRTLLKWGTPEQKRRWLGALARGQVLGSFALTEPGAGSALAAISTEAVEAPDGLVLNGTKAWISSAQLAGLFLVFGKLGGLPVACLVPRESPGVRVEPIADLLGFRAAGLGRVHFDAVEVPAGNVVGKPGFGLSHVAPIGLHYGRISTACSALGLARACFEESVAYAKARRIGDRACGDLGMVRSLIAKMGADLAAAGLLCFAACRAEDEYSERAFEKALTAKYFTSRAAVRAAADAVQIHGASGCHGASAVSRYYRDAKIMEIIEGTTQVQEDLLGKLFGDRAGRFAGPARPAPGELNRTEAAFPEHTTVPALIEACAAEHGHATAVTCDHDEAFGTPQLTYAELNARANQLAHTLRAYDIGAGDVVALIVERSYAMIIAVLGILKAGAAYLPVAPDNPPGRIEYLLRDAGVRIVLAQPGKTKNVAFDGRILDLEDADLYSGPTANPEVRHSPQDAAYVIYTSGSTGKPKGVVIEHRSLLNRLNWMQAVYPIGPDDVILQKTPYHFDVSVWELLWWAMHGAHLCFLKPGGEKNPLAILEAIKAHRVSVLHFVPSMLNVFLEALAVRPARVADALTSVRHVFASGEALTPTHVRKFNDVWGSRTGARLTNLYGPTEATIDVSYYDCPAHDDFDTIPIGQPIHNTKLYVIKNGREQPVGEAGELCIAGAGLARAYLNNPQLTAERFVDNPVAPGERIYRTGDIARRRADGDIEYLGREDQQVKIRGLRIELGEIESTVAEHPDVADCVATVKKYSDDVVLIVAHVVCRSELDAAELKEYVRARLPAYMVPNRFERVDEIPLSPTGKADRKALPEPVTETA